MIGTKHILLYTLVVSLVLVLSSCKSKVKMPTPPPQMPSIPSSKPPSSMPSIPSLPSKPSIPSASPPSIQPPSAKPPSPSMPSPSSPSQSKSSDKSKSKGKKGEQKEKGDRQQAGEDLQKAGEQIAQAGGQLGDGNSSDDLEPEFPVEDSDKTGDQPPDVLMPESDATSDSDELVFEESESSSSSSSASESSEAAETSSQSNSSDAEVVDVEEQSANEAIQAAQEALEEAGIALQTAGQAVSDAESDEALNEAEQLLSNARIKIILAEQDLGVLSDNEIDEETSADINAAINEANVYLVVATQSILNARTGLPEFPGGTITGNAKEKGPTGDLDEELEQSLIIFDGELEAARATIIDTTSAPTGDIVGIQTDRPSDNSTYPEEGEEQGGEQSGEQDEEDQIASAKPSMRVPEGIPSAQGDDIVAHQLREAATAENDPELKEKLWEEYRRYKSGL